MPITFDSERKYFILNTSGSTYAIKIYDQGYLLNLYYGKPIPDAYNLDWFCLRSGSASFAASNPFCKAEDFSPDSAPMEYGTNGAGDFRISAIAVRNKDGNTVTDIRYKSHKIYAGKPAIPTLPSTYANSDDEAETLEILTEDKVTGLEVTLVYTVFNNLPVMTKSVRVHNASDANLEIERVFSSCNDFPSMNYDMISLWGRHVKERNIARRPLAHGVQGVESKRGVTGHSQNNFVALVGNDATEEFGEAYGFNLVYSGNFSALAECDYESSTRFIMGINPNDFEWHLEPGDTFYAPEVVSVYSDRGIGEMSRIFHRFYNNNLIRGKYKTEKRPLLINSWEAAYFSFDTDKLVAFAESAKELGIEMLVMDDGWFGKRDNDLSSLGDWYVNEKKLGTSLKTLVDRVNAVGLKFGIWYEPEMISPDSDLYRAHPDWCVHAKDRVPMIGRTQYVIDMSRKEVRDNIWNQMYEVLSKNNIEYVKWDFNRNITDAASADLPPERQKEFFHRFILGTYDLMNRLVTTFPNIMLENCSGGGGRFDPAMLTFSPQIWTSDNTDAIDRLKIQFGTSMCYPASTMGAHISAYGRTNYRTKGDVAMWGSFGFELDPRHFGEEEKNLFKEQIAEYHKYYSLTHTGDLYRLLSPFDGNNTRVAWMLVSEDKSEAMLTMVCLIRDPANQFFIKCRGLDENKLYRCDFDGKVYSGALLMNAGINFYYHVNEDNTSKTVHFTEEK